MTDDLPPPPPPDRPVRWSISLLLVDFGVALLAVLLVLNLHDVYVGMYASYGIALPALTSLFAGLPSPVIAGFFLAVAAALAFKEVTVQNKTHCMGVNALAGVFMLLVLVVYTLSMSLPLMWLGSTGP